jgi:hypothetical protein
MNRPALQLHMNLGAEDHLNVLHHAHNSQLAVSCAYNGWTENVYSKQEAIQRAMSLEAHKVADCYVGQNPIRFGKTRAVYNVSCISSCYVDLDTYNIPKLKELDNEEILDLIRANHPDLPEPTMCADSGRGMYLIWVFKNTKPSSFLPAWQVIENNLVELLKPYGADPHCKDVSRVLRIAGTENSRSLSNVDYVQIAHPITFEELQRYSNKLTKQAREASPGKKHSKGNVVQFKKPFATRNAYTLAYQRMQDIRKLAVLRGGALTDLRKTSIYAYALSAAWYANSLESLQSEIQAFVSDCVAEPHKYQTLPSTVLKRYSNSAAGVTVTWKGKEWDSRYRMRNQTLIDLLKITPSEQKHLSCIISREEKRARAKEKLTKKRRAQGVVSRQVFEETAQKRRQQALELFTQGNSKAAIARQLNLSRACITQYLKTDC